MKRLAVYSAMLSLAFAGSAFAADLPTYQGPEAAVQPTTPTKAVNWTGFYAGVQGGYAFGDASAPYGFAAGGPYTSSQDAADQTGFFGGVHAGYDYQIDKIVLGVEGELEYSDVGGDDGGSGGDVNALNNNWQGSLRGRVGYAVDSVLLYGTAGAAFMNATATAPSGTDSADFAGWTAGLGLEYAVSDHLSARAEYRYTNFGKSEANPSGTTYYENYNPTGNSVRLGLSYRF